MTKDIELALAKGKVEGARKLLQEYYEAQDKANFYEAMRVEYDTLYKTLEVVVDAVLDEDGAEIEPATSYIDYQLDAPTFEEYKNETKSVIVGTETAFDDNGVEYQKEIFEEQQVRPYTQSDVTPLVDAYIKQATTPKIVTMRQARLALLQSGLLTTVQNAIANGTDEALKIEWEYATDVRRDWQSLENLVNALGMTDEQLDNLFVLAGTL